MIILPDRKISRSSILMAVPRREWMPPSHAQQKTFLGDEDRTRFYLKAKAHDGYVVWCGCFEDRDDADAFLYALISGSIRYERELWRLPSPEWHPGISTDLIYEFLTQTILTTTGSNQTYTSPSDWDNNNNQIECLGGAGSGGRTSATVHATGGGAGAYSAITNFSFASPGTTTATYRVGAGGASVASSSGSSAGNAGGASWFNNTADPGNGSDNTQCSAAGGGAGAGGSGSQNGGAAGASTSSWGQTKYSGGRGGNLTGASGQGASGGGGAAGPAGAGGDGVDSALTTAVETGGGSANNGTTAGAPAGNNNGSSGSEFAAFYGCGSGGGGRYRAGSTNAGNGGNYGGAGGGASSPNSSTSTSGAGRQGLIVIEYEPFVSSLVNTNLAMMGM